MDLTIRPLAEAEIDLVHPLAARSFDDLSVRLGRPVEPPNELDTAHHTAQHRYLQRTGSALGAYDGEGVLSGVALSSVRGTLWQLALLVVEPGAQSAGAGRALLEAALQTAPTGGVRTFSSSRDARALRAYAKAGFRLLPALSGSGVVDPAMLGDHAGVRTGDIWRDAERVGVAHLADDIAFVLAEGGSWLVADRGCALVISGATRTLVRVLSAGSAVEGQSLLRAALLEAGSGSVALSPLVPQQDWAVDVVLAARLELGVGGPVAVAGVADPLAGLCPPAAVMV